MSGACVGVEGKPLKACECQLLLLTFLLKRLILIPHLSHILSAELEGLRNGGLVVNLWPEIINSSAIMR